MRTVRPLVLALVAVVGVAGCNVGAAPPPPELSPPELSPPAPERVRVVDLKPVDGDLATQLRREVARAKKLGLQPYVEVTAEWCKPCVAIKRYLDDPSMVAAFRGTYLIRLDHDVWLQEQLTPAGIRVIGIPVFFELDGSGRATGRSITSSVWGDDIPANMAPPLKAFFHRS